MVRFNYDRDRESNCCHPIFDTHGNPVSFFEYNAQLRHVTSWRKFPRLQTRKIEDSVSIMGKPSLSRLNRPFSAEVTSDIFQTTALAPSVWNEIWTLTNAFFDTDRAYAESKLQEHQLIALFRTKNEGVLIGMASMDVYPVSFQGRRLAIIYTVHVLLYEEYRGHNLIQRLGLRIFFKTRLRFPFRSIYWFFDTYSYKGYLLLPRNFREFWPHPERATPEWERALIDHLALRTYRSAWRPEPGIVFRSDRKRMRSDVAPLNLNIPVTPELKFFSRANPGHAEGDMLVCLCPLTIANWISVGIRVFQRMRRRRRKFK